MPLVTDQSVKNFDNYESVPCATRNSQPINHSYTDHLLSVSLGLLQRGIRHGGWDHEATKGTVSGNKRRYCASQSALTP